ncbi:2OG-Fe(II) oxygenase [Candidatus Woesearchaeota archaeon]|nr:2OG-Fe(II) oxygenase [Candidatus Woesearchaeota archaeon]
MTSLLSTWITPEYLHPSKITSLQHAFKTGKPFPSLEFPRFFHPEKATTLLKALSTEKFYPKEADLFQFKQTNDLVSTANPVLQEFRKFLVSPEFVEYLRQLTNTKCLPGKIDMAGTLYEDTDFLLCHDDQLEHRAIAFFYYLSDLPVKKGGTLNLYASEKKQPTTVAGTIQPKFNTFAFFKVSPQSFHSVAEVLAGQRLAISGWFHDT